MISRVADADEELEAGWNVEPVGVGVLEQRWAADELHREEGLLADGPGGGVHAGGVRHQGPAEASATVAGRHIAGIACGHRGFAIDRGAAAIVGDPARRLTRAAARTRRAAEAVSAFALSGGELHVERVPLASRPTPHNLAYLETKRRRMGHLLPDHSASAV